VADAIEFLWYIPNEVTSGHRGDDTTEGWGTLEFSAAIAETATAHGFSGALVGTGWSRPDTFTISTALAARTRTFKPLCATRPGYWQPAQFACAAATLDRLSEGRLLVNIVTGRDEHRAYGDTLEENDARYARTREFMRLVRRLWTEEDVTFSGEFYGVEHSTVRPRPFRPQGPPLYFGGASAAAEATAAAEADVQLLWGESLALAGERIERLRRLSAACDRNRPLEFGLRVTTVVRETADEAWQAAEAKLGLFREAPGKRVETNRTGEGSEGLRRLRAMAGSGEVLDRCLWTAPAQYATGAATTWLVGSADEVAASLADYTRLGITHFILSDTPYQQEAARVGDLVIPRVLALTRPAASVAATDH
jgi:alkanesulfonate monooxygenase